MFQRIYKRIKWQTGHMLYIMEQGLNSFILLFCFIHFFLFISDWLDIGPSLADFERDGNILYIGKILFINMLAAYYAGRIVRLEKALEFLKIAIEQDNKEKRSGRR